MKKFMIILNFLILLLIAYFVIDVKMLIETYDFTFIELLNQMFVKAIYKFAFELDLSIIYEAFYKTVIGILLFVLVLGIRELLYTTMDYFFEDE